MKEHPLVGEIELITTGFAWWDHRPAREQVNSALERNDIKVQNAVLNDLLTEFYRRKRGRENSKYHRNYMCLHTVENMLKKRIKKEQTL